MHVVSLAVQFVQSSAKIATDIRKHLAQKFSDPSRDGAAAIFRYKDQMIM